MTQLDSELIILLFTHFEFKVCIKKQTKSTNNDNGERTGNTTRTTTQKQRSHKPKSNSYLCSLLKAKEAENLVFFPTSFLYYIIFLIFLCLLIISRDIIHYYHKYDHINPYILLTYSLQPQHYQYPPFLELQSVGLSDILTLLTGRDMFIRISDYILIYSVMLLLIWESLFSFYKYYTTTQVVGRYQMVSAKEITRKFMVYAVLFVFVFNIQIHFYYYLWPILLILHSLFNSMCAIKFSSLLLSLYRMFMALGDNEEITDENENILQTVYLIRRVSITCTVLQSVYLSLFTFSYSVNTICYLPIVWSISCLIYSLTFVRNRKYLNYKLFELKQRMKYETPFSHHDSIRREKTKSDPVEPSNIEASNQKESCTQFSTVKLPSSNTTSSTISTEHPIHVFSQVNMPSTTPQISATHPIRSLKTVNTSKALKLLGISTVRNVEITHIPPRNIIVHSQSDILTSPTTECDCNQYPLTPRKITYSNSDIMHKNRIETHVDILPSIDDNAEMEKDESQTMSYIPKLPLRRISSPSIPIDFVVTKQLNNNNNNNNNDVVIDINSIDYIDEDMDEEDDGDAECVFVAYNPNMEPIQDIDDDDDDVLDIGIQRNSNKLQPPLHLKHRRSNSDPFCGSPNDILVNINIDEVMDSLNLFAKYGFCSRNSINSLYQLTRYRNKMTKMSYQQTK